MLTQLSPTFRDLGKLNLPLRVTLLVGNAGSGA